MLVLTGKHIEYYRNEAHLYQKKTFTEPIVKVPYTNIKNIKKFAVTEPNVSRKLATSRFPGVDDPATLYKFMISVELEEGEGV